MRKKPVVLSEITNSHGENLAIHQIMHGPHQGDKALVIYDEGIPMGYSTIKLDEGTKDWLKTMLNEL